MLVQMSATPRNVFPPNGSQQWWMTPSLWLLYGSTCWFHSFSESYVLIFRCFFYCLYFLCYFFSDSIRVYFTGLEKEITMEGEGGGSWGNVKWLRWEESIMLFRVFIFPVLYLVIDLFVMSFLKQNMREVPHQRFIQKPLIRIMKDKCWVTIYIL